MESLHERNDKENYILYIHYCSFLGMEIVPFKDFTDSIYYDTYAKYVEFTDKEG